MTTHINPDNKLQFTTQFGTQIKYYDDGFGPLWLFRDTSGVVGIIRAGSWESAWEIVNDELLPPVSDERELKEIQEYCETHNGELPEGYEYMANFGNSSGIVAHDLNGESLDPLTKELLNSLQITMEFEP